MLGHILGHELEAWSMHALIQLKIQSVPDFLLKIEIAFQKFTISRSIRK